MSKVYLLKEVGEFISRSAGDDNQDIYIYVIGMEEKGREDEM